MNRRVFIGGLAYAAHVTGANERVTLALIGNGSQGQVVAHRAIQAGAQIKTVCDLALTRASDYRRVLDDKEIDAVIISTPDHCHAIQMISSCAAGKDVYCETPVSHTVQESHAMVSAASQYRRIVQVGTQRRSGEHFQSAVEYVASGKLGKVPLIKTWIDQAHQRVHNIDCAVWAIQLMHGFETRPNRISSIGSTYSQIASYDYGHTLFNFEHTTHSVQPQPSAFHTAYYGSEGTLLLGDSNWEAHNHLGQIETRHKCSPFRHEANFLACVKSRAKPTASIELAIESTNLGHWANLSYKVNCDLFISPRQNSPRSTHQSPKSKSSAPHPEAYTPAALQTS